ncbi:hypothetical protein [Geodermatophilus marinus]|uniref:hypothetical protein n=1 Tax=Geodermatophilus sp. LHW52908 TaxID=2303986 RepID=UPI0011C128D1|nr:hypothetical protein [Geodermatophilus sp. LHW52908]
MSSLLVMAVAVAATAPGIAIADPVARLITAGMVPAATEAVDRWRAQQAALGAGATEAGVPSMTSWSGC